MATELLTKSALTGLPMRVWVASYGPLVIRVEHQGGGVRPVIEERVVVEALLVGEVEGRPDAYLVAWADANLSEWRIAYEYTEGELGPDNWDVNKIRPTRPLWPKYRALIEQHARKGRLA